VHIIPVEKLDCAEAQDDYIKLYSEGKSYLKTQRLSELEAQLDPAKFVRVHRSFLISLAQLKSIERAAKDSYVAILHSGQQVPISRAGHERLKGMM
jgi:two-component system LytT family response regulator